MIFDGWTLWVPPNPSPPPPTSSKSSSSSESSSALDQLSRWIGMSFWDPLFCFVLFHFLFSFPSQMFFTHYWCFVRGCSGQGGAISRPHV